MRLLLDSSNMAIPVSQVKKEQNDDREINELAVQMAESNRKKMLSQQSTIQQHNHASQQALMRAGGQQMISFYMQKKQFTGDSLLPPKKCEEKKKIVVDEESLKGRFGWATIHGIYIPYIFRQEDKYCSVRIIDNKILNDYLSRLPHEIINCVSVRSFYIHESEAKLFNEINMRHCEGQFGREAFTQKDLVVKVTDAKCFYRFLDTCYKKLTEKPPKPSEYCGFVRINGESVVPYTVKESVKYVPLFYFEGETDTLKTKAEKIDSWELAYLKFCCKVQGIRNELFASDICHVVSLDDVKQYFPKDTQFEDWWPQKVAEQMRMISHQPKSNGNWTQRPPLPNNTSTPNGNTLSSLSKAQVPSTLVTNSHKNHSSLGPLTNLANNYNLQNNLQNNYLWQHNMLLNAPAAHAQILAATYGQYPNYLSMHDNNSSHLRPPPLVRSGQTTATSQAYSSSRGLSNNMDPLRQLSGWRDQNSNGNPLDALISVSHQSPSSVSSNMTNANASKSQNKVPPLIPVTNGMRSENSSSQKSGRPIDKSKLSDVPPFRPDPASPKQPYVVTKIAVGAKWVVSVNFGVSSAEPMIAIQDVIREWVPTACIADCLEVFVDVLRIEIYKANWHQVKSLMEAWGQGATPEVVPLIKASDLKKVLPQIKYVFENQKSKRLNQS